MTEIPLISRSDALDAAAGGAVLVTHNRRLARALKTDFDARQIAAGRGAWPAPDILSWGAWLERMLDDARHAEGSQLPRLLSPLQEQALWERIISETPEGRELLHPAAAAAECREAWSLAHGWDLMPALSSFPGNEDAHAFLTWSGHYRDQCETLGATDAARLPALCAQLVARDRAPAPDRIVVCGFDRPAPAQQALLAAWRGRGVAVLLLAPPERQAQALRLEFVSGGEELATAAQWARARLAADPRARIGIVVPELAASRSRVIRALAEALDPGSRLPGGGAVPLPFNLSLGLPLAEWPLVHTALALLGLARGALDLNALGVLLRSPFLAGAEAEAGVRARLDLRLRELGELEVDLGVALALAQEQGAWCAPVLAGSLRALQEWRKAAAGRRPLSGWGRAFMDLLHGAGFPGERSLSSAEYQTLRSWREVLGALATLDAVVGRVNFDTALSRLRRIAADTVFQPESRGAPVQVLGMLEAAGQEFDHLWVTGLSDEAWPPPPRPNPFLPVAMQRRQELPSASAGERLAFARRLTAGWLTAAREVVLSSPRREEDRDLGVSPLLAQLPLGSPASLKLDPAPDHRRNLRAAAALEDWRAPALGAGARLPGGAAVFADQAACPFRAFAAHRLGAQGIPVPEPGLGPLERGNLVHGMLAHVWKRLRNQDALLALDEGQRLEIVTEAARYALARLQRERAKTLSGRFLALEEERLARLARDWLQLELGRPPFEVAAVEDKRALALGGLAFNARLDRVDRLPDGRAVIIDYKTGKARVSDWLGERPGEPQLPLYCVTAEEEVAGIAFARVRTGDLRLDGLARDDDILPEGKAFRDTKHGADYGDWADLLTAWRRELERLAEQFAAGQAPVDPKNYPATCQYCELGPLCRVAERLRNGPVEAEGESDE